ncbi:MAG TPA: hypothetical protein DHW82_06810 [Spirochaetia bacterium]|nr:MAG: hypothetical protein A2Y41_00785 [Spirochaetes bacterium GWB1_36_13]HCL56705.1 hypothetical protein [Spirochaetia bacterium]
MNDKIEVEIFNERFILSSENTSEERLRKLAAFVDTKMREIYNATKLSNSLKLSLLLALNLADELFTLKETKTSEPVQPEILKRLFSIIERMESFINGEKAGE